MSFAKEKDEFKDYNFDRLLKEFKKKVENDGIIPEYKRRLFHEKPIEKKKRKQEAARRRRMKKENKN